MRVPTPSETILGRTEGGREKRLASSFAKGEWTFFLSPRDIFSVERHERYSRSEGSSLVLTNDNEATIAVLTARRTRQLPGRRLPVMEQATDRYTRRSPLLPDVLRRR